MADIFGGDPPAAPDYVGAAKAQGEANIQAAIINAWLNRPNEYTPYGSREWTQQSSTMKMPDAETGGMKRVTVPRFTSNINFTPEGKQLYDSDMASRLNMSQLLGQGSDRAIDSLSQSFDLSKAPPAYNQAAADAMYSRATRYMDPRYARNEENLRSRLAATGHVSGDAGYSNAMDDFSMAKDEAYQNAQDRAVEAGARIGSAERSQAIQEMLLQRQQPLTELASLRTGNAPTLPTFQNFASVNAAPAPIFAGAQAQGQAALDAYNAQQAGTNALLGGIFQLGAGYFAGGNPLPWGNT